MRYLVEGRYLNTIVEAKDKESAAFQAISDSGVEITNGRVDLQVSEIESEATTIAVKVRLSI